ncbi:FAD/NAD(P)-binding domain-containing protein [Viridothelium virens]|uniref:FAD/NAD(P)-binding domain-containing protein n=1 Tax=Viridothelium virens TaxID=1048519 RepID=A0A6A6HB32_VIRVR|nr:FAD/NAD(P)-binding domain-containing protein [Viridothelium virens]
MADSTAVDVLIIGSGPAGLSAALMLSRAVYKTAIFDSGVYRNALSYHMHVVPTWDHSDPAKYREAARVELKDRYGEFVHLVDHKVTCLKKDSSGAGFVAVDATGKSWIGKKVILATGNKDVFPKIEGYEECWVKGIFHCLFCHGFEDRGQSSAGVLAVDLLAKMPPITNGLSRNALQFARTVTIYTNGSLDVASAIEPMVAKQPRLSINTKPIRSFTKLPTGSSVRLTFDDGTTKEEGFLAHTPMNSIDLDFAKELNLEMDPSGMALKVQQPFLESTEPGVFVAGDISSPMAKMVLTGLTSGGFAANGIVRQLQGD